MKKQSFIPKNFRPDVPGSRLTDPGTQSKPWGTTRIHRKTIIISAKEDIVPTLFLNQIDTLNDVTSIFYDELGISWDFIYKNGVLTILTPDGVLQPKSIYHRHPGVAPNTINILRSLRYLIFGKDC